MARFFHVKLFSHGVTAFTTVKEVEVTDSTEVIADSGDDDTADTFVERGKRTVTGSVMIADPIQAYAMRAITTKADITCQGVAANAGTNAKLTVEDALFFDVSPRFMHNGVSVTRVTFRGMGVSTVALAS